MASDGDGFGDYDDDDFHQASSQGSQQLPDLNFEAGRPNKRRRISSDQDGSMAERLVRSDNNRKGSRAGRNRSSRASTDFISEDDLSEPSPISNRRASCESHGSTDEDTRQIEKQKAEKKQKPKHFIHIPKEHVMPSAEIQYATQLPDNLENPDSSPTRIRGAKWMFKKPEQPKLPPAKPIVNAQTFRRSASLSSPASRGGRTQVASRQQKAIPSAQRVASFAEVVNPCVVAAPTDRDGMHRTSSGVGAGLSDMDLARELEGLDSEDFGDYLDSDDFVEEVEADLEMNNGEHSGPGSVNVSIPPQKRIVAPLTGTRQQTLLGGAVVNEDRSASQVNKVRNYIVDMPEEKPSHHKLDLEALKTWVYPLNLGEIREYQFSIVSNALFNNTLVALPTGLGKTCIAATVMLNFYRWAPDSQIVFMAPTKPLVAQQVDACLNIVGIPRSETTMLNGEILARIRKEEWLTKRVFFMTPQTLDNDLRSGIADPKRISLLVVDEAHRATGKYAYVKVIENIQRFNESFRVLALTATPGSSVEAVQEVMDNLHISKVEIRTEESMDIRPYVHQRQEDHVELEPSDELAMIQELFCKAVQPIVDKLCQTKAYYNKDPMSLNQYALVKGQAMWAQSEAGRSASQGVKGMVRALYMVLISVAHAMKLLNFHGMGPFWVKVKEMRDEVEGRGSKGGKTIRQLVEHADFKKMMDRLQIWINNADFVGHPKLTYLADTLLNHFLDAGDGKLGPDQPPSATRAIVFCEYRESAEEIVRVLNRHKPMIRASVFVGQANTNTSDGMSQEKQQKTIDDFKKGFHNVIVATSIGEEGLDIGQVDLIVCYDSSSSPIRMLQRMGRTGRKRAGHVVLLLMKGKESDNFARAKDGYEKIQKMIIKGDRFAFRTDLSKRILPRGMAKPVVDKRMIEIPLENTQNPGLPEPKNRRQPKGTKKAAKKFNYPEGVELGFKTGKQLLGGNKKSASSLKRVSELDEDQQMPVPVLESVLLSQAEESELVNRFQNVHGDDSQEVSYPEMTLHPLAQRQLSKSRIVRHGAATKRMIRMIRNMNEHSLGDSKRNLWSGLQSERFSLDRDSFVVPSSPVKQTKLPLMPKEPESEEDLLPTVRKVTKPRKKTAPRRRKRQAPRTLSDGESVDNSADELVSHDDADDGSDLADFIDEEIRFAKDASNTRSSTPEFSLSPQVMLSNQNRASRPDEMATPKPFFEQTQFAPTQESVDDDMPDIRSLVGNVLNEVTNEASPSIDYGPKATSGTKGKRHRKIVEDSDDD